MEAIRVKVIDEEMSQYKTFTVEKDWLPHGKFNTSLLVQLMASRRSCRHFTDRPVEKAVLEDLVKIGITAPSGTNSQSWTFTILPARKAVTAFAESVACFFGQIEQNCRKASASSLTQADGQRRTRCLLPRLLPEGKRGP